MEPKTYDEAEETQVEETNESFEDNQEESQEESEQSTESVNWEEKYKELEREHEKAKRAIIKSKEKPKRPESSDDTSILRLEARGFLNKEDQEYIVRFAKTENISVVDALDDIIVQDRLRENERRRKSAQATPQANNRVGSEVGQAQAIARRYRQLEKEGKDPASILPNDIALLSKVRKELKSIN